VRLLCPSAYFRPQQEKANEAQERRSIRRTGEL
jgi:hypothetical protein